MKGHNNHVLTVLPTSFIGLSRKSDGTVKGTVEPGDNSQSLTIINKTEIGGWYRGVDAEVRMCMNWLCHLELELRSTDSCNVRRRLPQHCAQAFRHFNVAIFTHVVHVIQPGTEGEWCIDYITKLTGPSQLLLTWKTWLGMKLSTYRLPYTVTLIYKFNCTTGHHQLVLGRIVTLQSRYSELEVNHLTNIET